jgi:hypothetical protein
MGVFNTKINQMTDYQIDLVVASYFNKLMELGIKESEVKDFGQNNGELYIVLEDKKIIKEKIKNFY